MDSHTHEQMGSWRGDIVCYQVLSTSAQAGQHSRASTTVTLDRRSLAMAMANRLLAMTFVFR
jgi:hypothetical protein